MTLLHARILTFLARALVVLTSDASHLQHIYVNGQSLDKLRKKFLRDRDLATIAKKNAPAKETCPNEEPVNVGAKSPVATGAAVAIAPTVVNDRRGSAGRLETNGHSEQSAEAVDGAHVAPAAEADPEMEALRRRLAHLEDGNVEPQAGKRPETGDGTAIEATCAQEHADVAADQEGEPKESKALQDDRTNGDEARTLEEQEATELNAGGSVDAEANGDGDTEDCVQAIDFGAEDLGGGQETPRAEGVTPAPQKGHSVIDEALATGAARAVTPDAYMDLKEREAQLLESIATLSKLSSSMAGMLEKVRGEIDSIDKDRTAAAGMIERAVGGKTQRTQGPVTPSDDLLEENRAKRHRTSDVVV